ncbi:MAG: hypothetical protein HN704_05460 [Bacteroidetes bacterium]|jgi:hypothetical protein|nr:hypothetical protein [Bacteroidota bacterium]MBT6685659.1 hypothetical protein [Bacteroidota bacterium]MBT7141883.1 hypothetical protein [Bacteroidota bacterium]MBT7491040.1 hypothetical protein [Bacteroidota bacterium]
MKKITILFAFLLLIGFSISSCKECATCYISVPSGIDTTPEKFCGTNSEVSDFEKQYAEDAASIPGVGNSAVCSR